jgi:UDP-galactopyranose mutase
MKIDYLIVGAGFAGCVLAERIATQLNKKVLIVEKRYHIGGNAYDYYDTSGILVHKYGPHIFHTNQRKIWYYLSQFTEWHPYYHHVQGIVEGKNIPVPFNLNSIYKLFPQKYAGLLETLLIEKYGFGVKIPILKLRENQEDDLRFLADYIYDNVFYGYTVKQWGLKPEELDFSVTSRVPVYISRDDRYFQDTYQGIPLNGYTEMFKRMIAHPNIHLLLNTDYKDIETDFEFDRMIYTGPIDYFFDYIHGHLPYRSLRFDFKNYGIEQFQEVAQVNYPNNQLYTRITEFKHFNKQILPSTTVAYEYSEAYESGTNEPYYPIPRNENHELLLKYTVEAKKLEDSVIFAGRLAEYKYYNMDEIMSVALSLFKKKIAV